MESGSFFNLRKPVQKKNLVTSENIADVEKIDRSPSNSSSSYTPVTPRRASQSSVIADEIRHEVMCNYLFQKQCSRMWIDDRSGEMQGILIRKPRGAYVAAPPDLSHSKMAKAVASLNAQCVMTVNSRVVKTFLMWSKDAVDVPLRNGLRIQILPCLDDLPRARKHQFAAFLASEALLIVWDDEAKNIMLRARMIEDELMELVWKVGADEDEEIRKKSTQVFDFEIDEECGEPVPAARPTYFMNAIHVTFTLIIIITMLGSGFREISIEIKTDGSLLHLISLALVPIQSFFTLFFVQVIVGCLAQCIGPVQQMRMNSKFYSAIPPPRLNTAKALPHVTIQCPVYKEGLAQVIAPTVRSLKQAISTYELQGGSANIFINDDGLQIIHEEDRQDRIDFYADHSIGWVARPQHGDDGFVRRGKFKKASNMNFGLSISCKVEDRLAQIERAETWSQADEAQAYARCLTEILEENGKAWADGNVRVGDYILLVDSDTRVPPYCLLDAVSEMELSPEVGILQFSSGVLQVVHNYFENGITFFTNLIYTAIRYTVSCGDVAPFVGHNAILRWSAIQQVSFFDEDGYEKFWSESTVSEDFEMSLRLQVNGYIIRLAVWAGDGFKEGVSLTVYDELARWEKYAYGCNELLFHPFRSWITHGPFTPLFRSFLFSRIRLTSKITILAYIGTYYAIGAAWILTLANYFAVGWFNGYLDKYYIDSWKVWFSIVLVFNGVGNIALAALRYRTGEKSFFAALAENIKWVLMLAIFLGGLSLHISQALLAHILGIDMTWGVTAKEAEFSHFFIEVPMVLRRFKWSITFALTGIIGMILLAWAPFVPWSWEITDFVAVLPLVTVTGSHLLLPLVLNPALMTFSW